MTKKKLINISPKQLLTTILPLVIVAVYTCVSFSLIISTIVNENLENAATKGMEQAKGQLVQLLNPAISNLNTIGDIANIKQDKDNLLLIERTAAEQCYSVLAFYYCTAKPLTKGGFLIMSDGWQAPSDFDQTIRPWYIGAVEAGGNLYGTEPYINASTDTPCITFSKAVYDDNGILLGVVAFDVDLAMLTEQIGNIKVSESSSCYMITHNGTYVLNHDDINKIANDNYFTDIGFDTINFDIEAYLDGKSKTLTKGNKYYSMSQVLSYPWFLVIQGNTEDFTATHMRWFLIIIIVTIVLICICVGISVWSAERTKAKEVKLGQQLFGETQNLVVAAKENAATSQDQSAAVKEIVATMEDNNELSSNISKKIRDVSKVANKTTTDVTEGFAALEVNIQKLHEIFDANQTTIEGIKNLGDKIESIWDIVTLINSIADQAKIIAFNAELEASSAGEAGKNFHIVATEIRRLADSIIDGTKEIKEHITEIQQSSDCLIIASESGTEKINEGCEGAKELQNKFESIKNASEVTSESANNITTIIQQQAVASEQILITLKQIASGVETFSTATENISKSAQNLQDIAGILNEQVETDEE